MRLTLKTSLPTLLLEQKSVAVRFVWYSIVVVLCVTKVGLDAVRCTKRPGDFDGAATIRGGMWQYNGDDRCSEVLDVGSLQPKVRAGHCEFNSTSSPSRLPHVTQLTPLNLAQSDSTTEPWHDSLKLDMMAEPAPSWGPLPWRRGHLRDPAHCHRFTMIYDTMPTVLIVVERFTSVANASWQLPGMISMVVMIRDDGTTQHGGCRIVQHGAA